MAKPRPKSCTIIQTSYFLKPAQFPTYVIDFTKHYSKNTLTLPKILEKYIKYLLVADGLCDST